MAPLRPRCTPPLRHPERAARPAWRFVLLVCFLNRAFIKASLLKSQEHRFSSKHVALLAYRRAAEGAPDEGTESCLAPSFGRHSSARPARGGGAAAAREALAGSRLGLFFSTSFCAGGPELADQEELDIQQRSRRTRCRRQEPA